MGWAALTLLPANLQKNVSTLYPSEKITPDRMAHGAVGEFADQAEPLTAFKPSGTKGSCTVTSPARTGGEAPSAWASMLSSGSCVRRSGTHAAVLIPAGKC
jgi:hypothetical protein